jgi:hypothetical protein
MQSQVNNAELQRFENLNFEVIMDMILKGDETESYGAYGEKE